MAYNAEYYRQWRATNRERHNAQIKAWNATNPKRRYGYSLKRRYGISIEQYDEMLEKQNGVCAICKRRQEDVHASKQFLSVDHDADTGKVRGLLCHGCNAAIGLLNHDSALLTKAQEYLDDRAD